MDISSPKPEKNEFNIGKICSICENMNTLNNRYLQGKEVRLKIPLTWGESAERSAATLANRIKKFKPGQENIWQPCFSRNLRQLSNIVYYWEESWQRLEYRILKWMNIDYQNDRDILQLFKARAHLETTNINTRGNYQPGTSRQIIPENWTDCCIFNYDLVRDSQDGFLSGRDKCWDLVVKDGKLWFKNELKGELHFLVHAGQNTCKSRF